MLQYYNQMTAEYPAEADPVRIDYALQNLRGMNPYYCLHLEYRADLHTHVKIGHSLLILSHSESFAVCIECWIH